MISLATETKLTN